MKTINAKFYEAEIPDGFTRLAKIGYKHQQNIGKIILQTIEGFYIILSENDYLNNAIIFDNSDHLNDYLEGYVRDLMKTDAKSFIKELIPEELTSEKVINAITEELNK